MQQLFAFIVAMHARVEAIHEDRGATATEYALLVAFIALVITVGVGTFGGQLNDFFNTLGQKVHIVAGP